MERASAWDSGPSWPHVQPAKKALTRDLQGVPGSAEQKGGEDALPRLPTRTELPAALFLLCHLG